MKISSQNKGFTLIEVLMVIVVIAILAAIGTPMIMSAYPRYQLRGELRELLTNLKRAKVQAIKHNQDVVVLFNDGPGGSYQIFVNADGNTPPTLDAGDISILDDQQLNPKTSIITTFPSSSHWTGYDSRGMSLQAGNVVLSSSIATRTYTLFVSTVGNVRVQ